MRRLLVAPIAALALTAASPAQAADPVEDHRDTAREIQVDVAGQVAAAEPQQAATVTALPSTWCGTQTTQDDTQHAAQSPALPQFKLVYAYAADKPNRFTAWQDLMQANVSLISQFLALESEGLKAPRFDMGTTCGAQYADIAVVALPQPRAYYVDNFNAVRDAILSALHLPAAGTPRDVVVLADQLTNGGQWGIASLWNDDSPDPGNAHNSAGLASVVWVPSGTTPPADPTEGWWPEGFLHEMTHNMGGVQWSAPHNTGPNQTGGYFHCWDGYDVMCYADGPNMVHSYETNHCSLLAGAMSQVYDCGGDDYFNPAPAARSYLATHWNVFNSALLADCATLGTACATDPAAPRATTAPSVSGTPRVGHTLTGTAGDWQNAVGLALHWQRNDGSRWADIPGADQSTYTLTSADLGATVRLAVTASNAVTSQTASAPGLGPIGAAQPPVLWSSPTVVGTARRGATLGASGGAWSGATSVSYSWERETAGAWVAIAGATGDTYLLTADDVGARVRVRVRATNADGTTTATTAPLGPIADAPATAVPPAVPTVRPPVLTPPGGSRRTTVRGTPAGPGAVSVTLRGTGKRVRLSLRVTPDGARLAVALPATRVKLRAGRWRLQLCAAGVCSSRTVRAKRSIVLLPALKASAASGQTVRVTLAGPGRRLAASARI